VNGSVNSSAATVNSGGILAGVGSVSSVTLNAGGHIAPGSAAGTIGTLNTANGNFTWNGEGTALAQMTFNLGNAANMGLSATSDRISLGLGAFDRGTGSFFEFDFGNSGAHGNIYTLVTFGSQGGFTETDFSYAGLASGLTGTFSLTANSLQFTVVPEPSALALVGVALVACLGGLCRRRSTPVSSF
jgi:PEP-CTERM motif